MSHYSEYKTTDLERIFEVAKECPLAVICKNNAQTDCPDVVAAPMIHSSPLGFEFHMAQGNAAYHNFARGGMVHIVFSGPNAPISPSWYKTRFQDGDRSRTAPTWDYVQANVQAALRPMTKLELQSHLAKLVDVTEAPDGWSFSEIDPSVLNKWSGLIAGFYADIREAEATFKLSQEQSPEDRLHIAEALKTRARGDDLLLANKIRDLSR